MLKKSKISMDSVHQIYINLNFLPWKFEESAFNACLIAQLRPSDQDYITLELDKNCEEPTVQLKWHKLFGAISIFHVIPLAQSGFTLTSYWFPKTKAQEDKSHNLMKLILHLTISSLSTTI